MSAAKKANLDDRAERVYLTVLAHADTTGLVTQCSWTDIMDYAGIVKPDDARAAINDLIQTNILRRESGQMKKPIFRVLGRFYNDINDARAFQAHNQERVNGLRNSRTSAYSKTKAGRIGVGVDQIIIENLEYLPAKEIDKPNRWRFTTRIPGFGIIKNCIFIAFTHRQPEISGPSWLMKSQYKGNGEWVYFVEFEQEIYQRIYVSINEAIEQERIKKMTNTG